MYFNLNDNSFNMNRKSDDGTWLSSSLKLQGEVPELKLEGEAPEWKLQGKDLS